LITSALHKDSRQEKPISLRLDKQIKLDDFNMLTFIGEGKYGQVFLVKAKATNEYFAMKALKKDVVLQDDDVECTMLERDVCRLGNKNPYLTKLFCTFQNEVCFRGNLLFLLPTFFYQTHRLSFFNNQ
jgi:serine/threonine protein kinase